MSDPAIQSVQPGIYRHFKSNYYLVEDVALESGKEKDADQGPRVIYRKLYDDFGLHHRPLIEFTETVNRPEFNYQGPRFQFVREWNSRPSFLELLASFAQFAETCKKVSLFENQVSAVLEEQQKDKSMVS